VKEGNMMVDLSFVKDWWGVIVATIGAATGGLLWSGRLEWKLNEMERKEKEDPSVRNKQFLEFVATERTATNLKLDNLSSEIIHLREVVELYHKEVTDRLP
jgi:hypothetical protein